MLQSLPAPVRSLLPLALPAVAIFAARLATFTPWAAAQPGWAAIIFAWIVADALMLGVLAKAKDNQPALHTVLAALALGWVIVLLGAAAPVREVYFSFPQVLVAAGGTIALFFGWSAFRFTTRWRATGSVYAGLAEVVPELQLKFMRAEWRVLNLGLLSWNAPVDVPRGSQAFVYHTYLNPMIATFIALQVIELAVVHFLLMLWNPAVAWVLFAVSVYGVIWTVALLKSFRINPVLVSEKSVRVRSGMICDFEVPIAHISDVDQPFSKEELERKDVMNLAILSEPNIHLRFADPVSIPRLISGTREIRGVALRLDDSAGFLNAISARRELP